MEVVNGRGKTMAHMQAVPLPVVWIQVTAVICPELACLAKKLGSLKAALLVKLQSVGTNNQPKEFTSFT